MVSPCIKAFLSLAPSAPVHLGVARVLRPFPPSLSRSNHCQPPLRPSRPLAKCPPAAQLTKPRRRLRPPDAAAAMAPAVGIKRGSAATQTVALPPTDARLAVRDVMRSTIPSPPADAPERAAAPAAAMEGFLCLEEIDGRRWSYVVDAGVAGKGKPRGGASVSTGSSVRAVPMQSPLPPAEVSTRGVN